MSLISQNRKSKTKRSRKVPRSIQRLPGLEQLELGSRTRNFSRDDTLVCFIPRHICPKSVLVRLSFPDVVSVHTKTTSPVCSWNYRTSAWSPAVSAGSAQGVLPGFNEWATFYQNYRVHGIGIRGYIANVENLPIVLSIRPYPGPSSTDNSLTTLAQVYEQGSQPLSRLYTIAAVGGGESVVYISHHWDNTTVLGDTQWLTSDGYASQVTGNPSTTVNLLLAAAVINGSTNFVTGVSCALEVDLDVEFYGRQSILN